MGFRISWLAVPTGERDRLLSLLHLADTGEPDEANEAAFSIASLPTGWTVLWSNDQRYAAANADVFARDLSTFVLVEVNETCMHSTASLFDNGQRLWRVHHEGDEQIDFLVKEGNLPEGAAAIEAQAREAQAKEDKGPAAADYLFDVPLGIAQSICGFKHDLWGYDWGEPAFTVLEMEAARPRSLLSRLKGKSL